MHPQIHISKAPGVVRRKMVKGKEDAGAWAGDDQ